MTQDIFETNYDVTKQSKIKIFFQKYKFAIYSIFGIITISIFLLFFYMGFQEDKKISLADNYIKAKIYIEKQENKKAVNILNNLVKSDDNVYSSLAFFLMLNENLITDQKKTFRAI